MNPRRSRHECTCGGFLYASLGRGFGKRWADWHFARRHEACDADVVDDAKAAIINSSGIMDELLGQSPGNRHMDNGQVPVSRMSLHLNRPVTCRAQSLGQLDSFARKERRDLLAESQTLLNSYSEESPARVAQAIRQ